MNKLHNNIIAKRYINALIDMDINIDLLKSDFSKLEDISLNNNKFKNLVKYANINTILQEHILKEIIDHENFSDNMINFLLLITRNKSLNLIDIIIREFRNYIYVIENKLYVDLISATDLNNDQIMEIKSSLKRLYNKDIDLNLSIDENIIGGFIINIESEIFDNSLVSMLDDIKRNYQEIIS